MKQIDDIGLFQCKYESQLFEYSTLMKECSSKVFIKAYVFSSVQRRIASQSFIYESLSVSAAYDLIKKEKELTRGNDIYPSYVMAWIGYIMRYFSCTTNIPETVLYKKIKPEEFYMIYEAYHSLDNELAVKRIAEAKGINLELNNLNILKECNKNTLGFIKSDEGIVMNPDFEIKEYTPIIDDLWFREELLSDEKTMSFNHAYGGIIQFPKERWAEWYNKWLIDDKDRLYRYIQIQKTKEFIGEIAYHYDGNEYIVNVIIHNKYRGKGYGTKALKLLCELAKSNGIKTLCDDIAIDNTSINIFKKNGFVEVFRTVNFIRVKKDL